MKMMMTPRSPMLLLPVSLLAAILLAAADDPVESPGVYRNHTYRFEIQPPVFKDDPGMPMIAPALFFAPARDGFASNLGIQVQRFDKGIQEFRKLSEKQFKDMGFRIDSAKDIKVGKLDAVEFVYAGAVQGRDLKFLAWAIERGKEIYLVTGTTPRDHYPDFEKAFRDSLATLKFLEK